MEFLTRHYSKAGGGWCSLVLHHYVTSGCTQDLTGWGTRVYFQLIRDIVRIVWFILILSNATNGFPSLYVSLQLDSTNMRNFFRAGDASRWSRPKNGDSRRPGWLHGFRSLLNASVGQRFGPTKWIPPARSTTVYGDVQWKPEDRYAFSLHPFVY